MTTSGAQPAVGSARAGVARPAGGAAARRDTRAGWGLPLLVLIIGSFMSILDTSIVNVAILTIQNEFGANTDDVQWVVTGYTLALGVVVPASAWLGDSPACSICRRREARARRTAK